MKTYIVSGLLAALLTGCAATGDKQIDANKIALAYYSQNRVIKSFEVTGANSINFAGSNMTFAVSNEMQPLSLIPREPGLMSTLIPALKDTALMGAGILTAGSVMKDLAKRPATVSPEVVRPEVVSPEVIQVPAP